MRILIVAEVYLPKIDGVVRRTLNLIEQLQQSGDEVLVICPEADGERDSPVPIVEFPGFSFPMYPEYKIGIPDQRLIRAVRKFQPDVVHFVNPFAFGFRCYDVLQKSDLKLPVVFSFHTLYAEFVKRYGALKPMSRMLWWLTRQYHNHASVNLTVSSITQCDLQQRGFRNVRLWQPAVDAELFRPERRSDDMKRRLAGSCDGRRVLLTVSRLAPEKNVEFLKDVLRRLPDTTLAVVGDGPHRCSLERHFQGLPVTFMGYMGGEELAAAYASADAFVYASETETMGNVVLEAMAAGSPVVAVNAGGIPSLLRHEETGMLFAPGNDAEAAGYVQQILTDSPLRLRLSVAARQFALGQTWSEAALGVRSDYERAIQAQATVSWTTMPRTSARARTMTRVLVRGFQMASALTTRRRLATKAFEVTSPSHTQVPKA